MGEDSPLFFVYLSVDLALNMVDQLQTVSVALFTILLYLQPCLKALAVCGIADAMILMHSFLHITGVLHMNLVNKSSLSLHLFDHDV